MKHKPFFLSLKLSAFLVFSELFAMQPSVADTSIAQSKEGLYYYATAKTLSSSDQRVLTFCQKSGGSGCTIINRSKPHTGGFGALAESKTRYGVATGYDSIETAKDAALDYCVQHTSVDDECRITMTFYDKTYSQYKKSKINTKIERYDTDCENASCVRRYYDGRVVRYTACVNPATGLPMLDPNTLGGCNGVDSRGNPFGVQLQ